MGAKYRAHRPAAHERDSRLRAGSRGTARRHPDGGGGAVDAHLRGERRPPMRTRWVSKPAGESYEAFLAGIQAPTIWQRQRTLGPDSLGLEECLELTFGKRNAV